MKVTFTILSRLVLVILIFSGCANWGGNNPVGITGGSDQGYGEAKDLDLPSVGSGSEASLIGSWRHEYSSGEYEIITFNQNGKFSMSYYDDGFLQFSFSGNYSTSGTSITLFVEGQPLSGNYSIQGDELTLYLPGDSQTYYRI